MSDTLDLATGDDGYQLDTLGQPAHIATLPVSTEIHQGDAVEVMAGMAAESVDAIVTDPPYMIGVLGNEWDRMASRDFQAWCQAWAAEALRVLKPGGYLASFGSPRTYHRLAAGIEDAGFTIRDGIAWLHTQGFPPSLDVSEAVEAFHAGDREEDAGRLQDVLTITGWLRDARDAAGWTNRQIDALFGTAGMAGHWTSRGSQPADPQAARPHAVAGGPHHAPRGRCPRPVRRVGLDRRGGPHGRP